MGNPKSYYAVIPANVRYDNNIPTSIYPVLIIRKHKTRKEAIGKTFITYAKELNHHYRYGIRPSCKL